MDSEKNELNALIVTVSIAENECHLAGTDVSGSAAMPAETLPTSSENGQPVTVTVTPTNTKRHPAGLVTVKTCQHCGIEYRAKRPAQSRFCGSRCRRLAWLERNPERAAALAERDRQRLRLHLAGRGIAWQERGQP